MKMRKRWISLIMALILVLNFSLTVAIYVFAQRSLQNHIGSSSQKFPVITASAWAVAQL